MKREDLLKRVRFLLARTGFYVSRPLPRRSISFDMVARRDDSLLIVKVLSNVDAFSRDNADEMKVLAEALNASPLLVGERSGSGHVEEGIVYSRFGVAIISLETLSDFVMDGVPPFIFAAPGGLYVRLDDGRLRDLREERNISLGTLANIAGVSRRTIQMYESGMGAMIDVAVKIEDYLDESLVLPIDPFDYSTESANYEIDYPDVDIFGQEVFSALQGMGFSIVPTVKCPFEALTTDQKILFLTGLGADETKLEDKAMIVGDISRITERMSVIFIERVKSRVNIEGTPLVGRDELRKLDETDKFYDLVEDRCDQK
ncbi:MAG: transcriptional regulator [Methanomassiliicoccales archaeon]